MPADGSEPFFGNPNERHAIEHFEPAKAAALTAAAERIAADPLLFPVVFDSEIARQAHLFETTEIGLGERFFVRHRDRARYCPARGLWLLWQPALGRWQWDSPTNSAAGLLAAETTALLHCEIEPANDKAAKAFKKFIQQAQSVSKQEALLKAAARRLTVDLAELDASPDLLNCANGQTLDFRTGAWHAACPADLITKTAGIRGIAAQEHPLWRDLVDKVTSGDRELERYLQRMLGYALQGRRTAKTIWLLHGLRDSLKTSFARVALALAGDYGATPDSSTWLEQRFLGGNRGDLVALAGVRLAFSDELPARHRFDTRILKQVATGAETTAAAKYERDVKFRFGCALWLAANDWPEIDAHDDSSFAKIVRVPFNYSGPAIAGRDQELLANPEAMASAAAWALEGARLWREQGFGELPATLVAARAEYREEMDQLGHFFEARLRFGANETATSQELRSAYLTWHREERIPGQPLSQVLFAARLKEEGCERYRTRSGISWRGAAVRFEIGEPFGGSKGTPAPNGAPN